MDGHSISLIFTLIILIGLSAFFSATETAFNSLNKARIKAMAQDGNRKALLALKLSEDYDKLLSTILIGNNIVNIAATSIATILFVSWLPKNGAVASTVVMTLLVLIFGEITPKSLAKESAEKLAMTVAPIIALLNKVFTPLNWLLLKLKGWVSGLIKVDREEAQITEDEIMNIVDEAEQVGGIDENEGELLRNVLEFNDLEAGDILTPRIDLTAVDKNSTIEEIAKTFKETGFSRLPVYEESIDTIVGVINEKDFHNYVMGTDNGIDIIMKKAAFIPPSVKISELLKKLQFGKTHIAVVVDEFGGTQGIVTLEDILEELVGEIWDEHDEIEAGIKELPNDTYCVPTSCDLDDFLEKFDITEDEDSDATTINGWIMEQTDKIPELGESFDFDNLTIRITKVDGPKADEILVKVNYIKEKTEEEIMLS
ncbi:MAG: hemolysin family protein [Clostridia bacterium]|nr:hemolysin family protein [Clostridia bacterium]